MAETTFIHTADLHLKGSGEESFLLLRWLLEKCVQRDAALLVAGDFFDSEDAAAHLRGSVRALFNEAPDVPKFILPGNCDQGAFSEKIDYGVEVYLLDTPPFTCGYHEDVEIVGFPFVPNSSLRSQLDGYRVPGDGERPVVAVVHGTYFSRTNTSFFLDVHERGQEYFPIYSYDIEDIEACYVALGHYHAQHSSFVHKDSVLCYPGTPLALSGAEVGMRTVVAITVDAETGETDIERLPVPIGNYNVGAEIQVFPWYEEDALTELEQLLRGRADSRAAMAAQLRGCIRIPGSEMDEKLAQLERKFGEQYAQLHLLNETTSYRSLTGTMGSLGESCCGGATPLLVRDFVTRLAAIGELDRETKTKALEVGLRAFLLSNA